MVPERDLYIVGFFGLFLGLVGGFILGYTHGQYRAWSYWWKKLYEDKEEDPLLLLVPPSPECGQEETDRSST